MSIRKERGTRPLLNRIRLDERYGLVRANLGRAALIADLMRDCLAGEDSGRAAPEDSEIRAQHATALTQGRKRTAVVVWNLEAPE